MKWVFVGARGVLGIGILLYVIGLFLPQAHVASSSVLIRQPVDSVWRVVRTFDEYDTWWPALFPGHVEAYLRVPSHAGELSQRVGARVRGDSIFAAAPCLLGVTPELAVGSA